MHTEDEKLLLRAIALAQAARDHGNHPFGALLAAEGRVIYEAENTQITLHDLTHHAELNLIRDAQRVLSPDKLAAATLYASTEPCAMCAGLTYWAGIRRVVFGFPTGRLQAMAGGGLATPCREVFRYGTDPIEVVGPLLLAESERVHAGFW